MWILILTVIFIAIYCIINFWKVTNFWKSRGVKYVSPRFIFGNMWSIVSQQESPTNWIKSVYDQFPKERYFGTFNFTKPVLVIRDPELIRTITIKNFENFTDHPPMVPPDLDVLWGKNLFASNGQRWKSLRQTMSPVFTGSKMRLMYTLMDECAVQFVDYFHKQGRDIIEVDIKEMFTRYTSDVIGSTAFGIKIKSLEEPNNEFLRLGRELADFEGLKGLKFLCFGLYPKITKLLGLKMINDRVGNFFRDIIKQTIQLRESNQVNRPDLIQLLLQARHGKVKVDEEEDHAQSNFGLEANEAKWTNSEHLFLTDEDITAQAVVFFFGGFDTVSYAMSFTAHILAEYPDIQNRLRAEILNTLRENNNKIDYNVIMKMKYLDMVICESIRLWPQAIWLERLCTKPFTIEPENKDETPIKIDIGQTINIPVYALHRNPEYYSNPDKFDPERFSDENRKNIPPFTYLPFGVGPRHCIGFRFALLETKTILVHLLKCFEIIPTSKTTIPLKLSTKSFAPKPEGGFQLGLKPIY